MTTFSNKDRAEAQAMSEVFHGHTLITINDNNVRWWLAVRDHVLASHTCQPGWRPTTAEEIQPGWEVRSRCEDGTPQAWGIAHHRDEDGDWRTEPEDAVLTYDAEGWTYETTAPPPAVDHTHTIAEAAREYMRGLREWESGDPPYPFAAEEALIAAVEAEHTEKEEK